MSRLLLKALLILLLLTLPSFAQRSLNVVKSTQTLSAGSSIDCSGPRLGGGTIVTAKIAGNGGAVDLTSNPQILTTGRTAGDICYLLGTSDTNTVKIDNGTGVVTSASVTLANNQLEQFVFDGTNWLHTPSTAGGGGAVDSVFGRTGAVTAATSDYDAAQMDFTPAGTIAGNDVQEAIEELDTEKVPATRTVSTTAPVEGGGDLGANRTVSISVNNLTDKPTPSTSDRVMIQQPTGEFRRADIGNLPVPTIDLDDLSDVVIASPATDEVLKFNGTNWINGTDATGGGGSSPVLDLGDNGVNESTGLGEIATTGDTNSVFTEPLADKLLIDLTKDWPKADDADQVTCTGCIADSELASTFAKESFKTWDAPAGTDPVADTAADTIILTAGLGLAITGDNTADSITHSFNYGLTLAGNAALGVNECVFSSEGAGGGLLCEGSVADNFEGLFKVPDTTAADATRTLSLVPSSFTSGNCVEFDANGQPADAGSACGTASGTSITLDLGDDGGNDSIALSEIATTGDTNAIVTEPSADKALIDMTKDWPKADVADEITCTGCVVDAELATDFISEAELDTIAELDTQITDADIVTIAGTETLTAKTIDGNDNTLQARRHATDCTSLTGKSGEACYEQDADTWYVCEPSAGDCDTAGEWKLVNANNAVTSNALAANPTDCSANQFANAIAANGNLTCAGVTGAQVANTPAGNIAATDSQTAINELDTEKVDLSGDTMTGVLNPKVQSLTIADSGNGSHATDSATTIAGNILAVTCSDADGCDLTLSETSTTDGEPLLVFNAGTSNILYLVQSAGVAQMCAGATISLAAKTANVTKSAFVRYVTDRWQQDCRQTDWSDLANVPAFRKTLVQFKPASYEPPASNFATLDTRNSHPILNFDTTTSECANWSFILPNWYGGNGVTVEVWTVAPTATTGTVQWSVDWERIEASQDIDSDGFTASANTTSATSVSGTSGIPIKQTVTFTNGADMDSCAAGELCRVQICRAVSGDTLAEDASMVMADVIETP